ncbi:MAG TPA: TetR/AcrR family transcriptional regulator, partial [Verrucomicrobiae bacterium]|nr:TetR/AcrR family transcriptional regulator [Verrucomicrobiae bacterium]
RGYYGTSLRMIARVANISPSLLQKYFPTKESVIAAFVERAIDELDAFVRFVRSEATTTEDPPELLRRIGSSYVGFLNSMSGFYLTWLMCPELVEPYRDSLPHFITAGHKILAEVLSKRTGIPLEITFLRVRIFFGSLFGSVIYYDRLGFPCARAEGAPLRLEAIIDSVLCDAFEEKRAG